MKIHLKIIPPDGQPWSFERTGQSVRIGRDPDNDLVLEHDDIASRHHARIEQAGDSARLIDLGSSNGTFHNDQGQKLAQPVTLRAGDRFRIGAGGSRLVVLDLDCAPLVTTPPTRISPKRTPPPLAPPRPAPTLTAPARTLPVWLLAAGGGLVALLLAVGAFLIWRFSSPGEDPQPPPVAASGTPPTTPVVSPGRGNPKPGTSRGAPVSENPTVTPPPPPSPPLPPVEIKGVGHYLRPKETRPGILLQREAEDQPWVVLRPGQRLFTTHTLVSLPGYESLLSLDGGLRVILWGNLPEFQNVPVLESIVVLNVPEEGFAADLTLDRGRVEIGNETAGKRQVRLRFLNQIWDITLAEPQSKVCVELLQLSGATSPTRILGLFSQDTVRVRANGKEEREFTAPGKLAWVSDQTGPLYQERLGAPPDWWVKPPSSDPQVVDCLLSLGDWAGKLDRSNEVGKGDQSYEVLDTVLTVVRESRDRTERVIGLWFLGAMEEVAHLVEFLEHPDRAGADLRSTAMLCLQDWLVRYPQRKKRLVEIIQQRRGYSRDNAELIVSRLAPLPPEALTQAGTYEGLIDQLDHDKLAVRHLAYWYLYGALAPPLPEEAWKKLQYDPTDERARRQESVAQWRKVLPPGTVPRPPTEKGQ